MIIEASDKNDPQAVTVRKIISGGQTGGDQGGLWAARLLGISTGGTAPQGWKTETGSEPRLALLGLVEHESAGYPARTLRNVQESTGTLIFGNSSSPGCRLTRKFCLQEKRPFYVVPWFSGQQCVPESEIKGFRDWLTLFNIEILNVAGNRESSQLGISRAVRNFLLLVFERGDLLSKPSAFVQKGTTS